MLAEFLAALEALPLAAYLRNSTWSYPLVNAAHIVGIALIFGAIVPLDLRLLGVWPRTDAASLSRVLVPVAMTGIVLAVAAGALLFITNATDYAASGFFQAKLAVVALAVANALWLRRGGWTFLDVTDRPPGRLRLAAFASISLWLGAIVLGRLIGYF